MQRRVHGLPIVIAACLLVGLEHLGCSPDPEVDTDGDGLSDTQELNVTSTSPLLADTDGDGFSDYYESVTMAFDPSNNPYKFNPLVADLPLMVVVFPGPPILTVDMTDTVSDTYSPTNALSDTMTTEVTSSQSPTAARSDTFANATTVTNSASLTMPVGIPVSSAAAGRADAGRSGAGRGGAGRGDAGRDATADAAADAGAVVPAELTLTNAVSTTVSPATTFTTSLTLTNAVTQADSVTLTRSETIAATRALTAISGHLKVPAIIENRSDRAFIVANLVLGAWLLDPSGAVIAVQDLILDQGTNVVFAPFSLAPWEQSDVTIFTTIPLNLETTRDIAFSGALLVIRVAIYELADAMGKPFSFDVEAVEQKTALVAIDYGGKRDPELYQVATNANPDRPGTTASKILKDVLRIPYEADPKIGITSVRDVAVSSSGGPRWSINRRHTEGPVAFDTPYGADGVPYDLDDIDVQAGDVLRVALEPANAAPSDAGFVEPPLAAAATIDGGQKVIFDATVVSDPSLSAVSVAPSAAPSPPAASIAPSASAAPGASVVHDP